MRDFPFIVLLRLSITINSFSRFISLCFWISTLQHHIGINIKHSKYKYLYTTIRIYTFIYNYHYALDYITNVILLDYNCIYFTYGYLLHCVTWITYVVQMDILGLLYWILSTMIMTSPVNGELLVYTNWCLYYNK